MTETVEVKLPRRNMRRCRRCAFARMSDEVKNKEVDMCHYHTLEQPTRIISLHVCPKAAHKMGLTVGDACKLAERAKGEFEG